MGAVHAKPILLPVLEFATTVITPGANGNPAARTVKMSLACPSIGFSPVTQN